MVQVDAFLVINSDLTVKNEIALEMTWTNCSYYCVLILLETSPVKIVLKLFQNVIEIIRFCERPKSVYLLILLCLSIKNVSEKLATCISSSMYRFTCCRTSLFCLERLSFSDRMHRPNYETKWKGLLKQCYLSINYHSPL